MTFNIRKPKKQNKDYWRVRSEMEIYEIGLQHGLSGTKALTFAMFIKERFPNEKSEVYIEEWAERFATGEPEKYMDSQSLKIYKKVSRNDEMLEKL